MTADNNFNYFPLPYEDQGFFYRMGDADLKTGLVDEDVVDTDSYYFMEQICILVNTADLMRKNKFTFDYAADLAKIYLSDMCWEEMSDLMFLGYDQQLIDEFHTICNPKKFISSLVELDLELRDRAIEGFKERLYNIRYFSGIKQTESLSHHYFAYIEYAFNELLTHWAVTQYRFLAPIFPTAPLDPNRFGCDRTAIIPTVYIPQQNLIHVYDRNAHKIVLGSYKDGRFEASSWNGIFDDPLETVENNDNYIQKLMKLEEFKIGRIELQKVDLEAEGILFHDTETDDRDDIEFVDLEEEDQEVGTINTTSLGINYVEDLEEELEEYL